ncbi:conserved hypothetical protein [Trichinella spiralis]|uniref:hypothetical protein n=1 Tax=Trichinella spiralis TaxID=6334 RepID=UPI0001EFDC5D|nr:conserved hypothetical protein [Trichinella spiralis]
MNACLQSSQCNGMALCFRRQCISAEVLHGQTKMCRRDIECRRQLPAHERLIVGCKNDVCAKLITVPNTSKCASRNQCPGQSICFRRHCIPAVPRNYSCQRNAQCHPTERCIGGLCFGLLGTTAESTRSLIGYADDDMIDFLKHQANCQDYFLNIKPTTTVQIFKLRQNAANDKLLETEDLNKLLRLQDFETTSSTNELILPSQEYSDIEEDISETEDAPELSSDIEPPSSTDSSSDESSEGAFSSSTNALMSKNGSMQWYSSPMKKGRLAESNVIKLPPGPTHYAIAKITDIRSSFALFISSRMEKIILQMKNLEGKRLYKAPGNKLMRQNFMLILAYSFWLVYTSLVEKQQAVSGIQKMEDLSFPALCRWIIFNVFPEPYGLMTVDTSPQKGPISCYRRCLG